MWCHFYDCSLQYLKGRCYFVTAGILQYNNVFQTLTVTSTADVSDSFFPSFGISDGSNVLQKCILQEFTAYLRSFTKCSSGLCINGGLQFCTVMSGVW